MAGKTCTLGGLRPTDNLNTLFEKVAGAFGQQVSGIALSMGAKKLCVARDGKRSLEDCGITNNISLTCVRCVTYSEAKHGSRYRWKAYEIFGTPDEEAFAPIDLGFMLQCVLGGAGHWPGQRAWRWIRGEGCLVYASDGLSDPWDPEVVGQSASLTGFGLEVFMGSAEVAAWEEGLRYAVGHVSDVVAAHGGTLVHDTIEERGCLSLEISGPFPEQLLNSDGRMGALLGHFGSFGAPAFLDLPGGSVRFVEMVALTPRETDLARSSVEACREIFRRLKVLSASAGGQCWLSSAKRPSVIDVAVDAAAQLGELTSEMVAAWPPMPAELLSTFARLSDSGESRIG